MLGEGLKLQPSGVDFVGSLRVSWDLELDHKLLLKSLVRQISIQNGSKIVDFITFSWHVEHNMTDTDVKAEVDFLLHDRLTSLLYVLEWAIALNQVVVDFADDSFLPPAVLHRGVYTRRELINQASKLECLVTYLSG